MDSPIKKSDNNEDFHLFKKLFLIIIFFTLTPIALVASTISLLTVSNSKNQGVLGDSASIVSSPKTGVQVYASLPSELPTISGEIIEGDARPVLIRNFMTKYKSQMAPYAEYIVQRSDEYGLDFRLTTAIAMKESGLGKAMPYDDCNNAWGYGIHSSGTLCFDNWEEGIDYVSKGLKENYIDMGYVTVDEIMKKYAHPLSTTWADGVKMYMDQI